ncbi:MAG: sensor histidine kinase [Dehalococcoidia bacterium]
MPTADGVYFVEVPAEAVTGFTAALPAGVSPSGFADTPGGDVVAVFGTVPFVAFDAHDRAGFDAVFNRTMMIAAGAAAALSVAVAVFLGRRITQPLHRLADAATAVGNGALAHRIPVEGDGEIRKVATAFNSMASSLAKAEELRQAFLSDAAHELRTPLQNLTGYLGAFRDGALPADDAALSSLLEETGRLVRLVDDLEALSTFDAGAGRLEPEPVDLGRLVEAIAQASRARADAGGITLEVTASEGVVVEADAGQLAPVIRNLAENALRHTPAGGRVRLSAEVAGEVARVVVSDTGEGIPAEAQGRVFERFYRVDPSRARHTGGAGLGLAIAKRIVDAHRGRIAVRSEVGRGSAFEVCLPRGGRDAFVLRPEAPRPA